MLIDIVYSVLAVYKAAIIWKETTGLTGAKLAFNLIRDQAIYFFVCVDTFSHSNLSLICDFYSIIWIALFNVISYSADTSTNLSLILTILGNPLLLSPFAARCVLDMKKAGDIGGNAGSNCVISLSTAHFNDNQMLSDTEPYVPGSV